MTMTKIGIIAHHVPNWQGGTKVCVHVSQQIQGAWLWKLICKIQITGYFLLGHPSLYIINTHNTLVCEQWAFMEIQELDVMLIHLVQGTTSLALTLVKAEASLTTGATQAPPGTTAVLLVIPYYCCCYQWWYFWETFQTLPSSSSCVQIFYFSCGKSETLFFL